MRACYKANAYGVSFSLLLFWISCSSISEYTETVLSSETGAVQLIGIVLIERTVSSDNKKIFILYSPRLNIYIIISQNKKNKHPRFVYFFL